MPDRTQLTMKGHSLSTSDDETYGFVRSPALRSASFSGCPSNRIATFSKHHQMDSEQAAFRRASTPICPRSLSPTISRSVRRRPSTPVMTMTPIRSPPSGVPARSSSPISSGYDSGEDEHAALYATTTLPWSPVPRRRSVVYATPLPRQVPANRSQHQQQPPCCSHCQQPHSNCMQVQPELGHLNETYLAPVAQSPPDGVLDTPPSSRKLLNSSQASTDSGVFSYYSDDSILSSKSVEENEPIYETIPDLILPPVPSMIDPVIDYSEPEYETIDDDICDVIPVVEVAPPLPARNYSARASLKRNTPHPSYKNYKGRVRTPPAPHLDDIVKDTDIVDMSSYHMYTVKDVLESIERLSETLSELEPEEPVVSPYSTDMSDELERNPTSSPLRRFSTQEDIPSVISRDSPVPRTPSPVPDTRWRFAPCSSPEQHQRPLEYISDSGSLRTRWDDSILAVEGTMC